METRKQKFKRENKSAKAKKQVDSEKRTNAKGQEKCKYKLNYLNETKVQDREKFAYSRRFACAFVTKFIITHIGMCAVKNSETGDSYHEATRRAPSGTLQCMKVDRRHRHRNCSTKLEQCSTGSRSLLYSLALYLYTSCFLSRSRYRYRFCLSLPLSIAY